MKIAIFLPNWIGDAVMATPALRALRSHFAGARILAVLKPYIRGVFEGMDWLDEFIFLDGKGPSGQRWRCVAARLRAQRADLAVLFPNSFHSAWVAWLGSCSRRIGFARYGRSVLLTDHLAPRRDWLGRLRPSPVIHAYNQLAIRLGCPDPGYRMELCTTPQDEWAADQVWQNGHLDQYREVICLNPGAAFGSAKHWPVEYFATLARQLVDMRGSAILVLCGPGEQAMAGQIVCTSGRANVHSLANCALSIGLTKACIRRATLLVTTDSGPRHFAAAFGKPVITIFGPTHIEWTETYYPQAIHLQEKVDCGPCQLRVCPLDHRCMTKLTPDKVLVAVEELLARTGRKAG
jgi:heptosyltransferase-2